MFCSARALPVLTLSRPQPHLVWSILCSRPKRVPEFIAYAKANPIQGKISLDRPALAPWPKWLASCSRLRAGVDLIHGHTAGLALQAISPVENKLVVRWVRNACPEHFCAHSRRRAKEVSTFAKRVGVFTPAGPTAEVETKGDRKSKRSPPALELPNLR